MKDRLPIKYVYFYGGHPNSHKIAEHLGAVKDEIPSTKRNLVIFGKTLPTQWLYSVWTSLWKAITTKRKNGLIYFCEGTGPILFPILMRKLKHEENIIISRINDEAFNFSEKSKLSRKYHNFLFRHLNGVIGCTSMVADDGKKIVKCPVYYAIYTTWRDYSYFAHVKPDFKHKNFAFVGEYREHKGIDILAESMKLLKKKGISVKTYLIGDKIRENLEQRNLSDSSFIYTGKSDPRDYFPKCAFYIHTARYEAGPTTVMEAMAAGLIPFVSMKTGVRDIVRRINPSLVIDSLDPKIISEHIAKFIKTKSESDLLEISKKCKAYVRKNNLKACVNDYEEKFKLILKKNNYHTMRLNK